MNLFEPLQPSGPAPLGAAALRPGAMLEDFKISEVLGFTGSSVLYLATRASDHGAVMLKEYLPSSLAVRHADGQVVPHPEHEEAFARGLHAFAGEALALSQFDHPNLLTVSCVWECNGTAYRAMPRLAGTSLLEHRSNTGAPATQKELYALLDGLLNALHLLNSAGLAHGRVEPANIFMAEDEHPVLMDFGAVQEALLSEPALPHVETYADAEKVEETLADDLHAVASFFTSRQRAMFTPPRRSGAPRIVGDVLLRLKEAPRRWAMNLFLSAIDNALALAPRTARSVTELRALFLPTPRCRPTPGLPAPPSSSRRAHQNSAAADNRTR